MYSSYRQREGRKAKVGGMDKMGKGEATTETSRADKLLPEE